MSPRIYQPLTVIDAAMERMLRVFQDGHRPVVSFSGGKDSTVVLEVTIMAAKQAGRLPVDVVMRDDEIMLPGTFEYAERTYHRPEVNMLWLVARQPVVNVFNRESPYFWAFDPLLDPSEWVRTYPDFATHIQEINIDSMTTPKRFPPEEGKEVMAVIGLRTEESRGRLYGIFSSGGYLNKNPNRHGVRGCRPIYDWADGDVWRSILEYGWDYNEAYDHMYRFGVPRKALRIAPPTMNAAANTQLSAAAKIWPKWFDRVSRRLPGVRTAAMFGKRSLQPIKRDDETWEQCFKRTCITEAPQWIAERAAQEIEMRLRQHAHHASTPFPEVTPCYTCYGNEGSWKAMAFALYNGDPFSMKTKLPYVEPEAFRPGAGTWGGTPSFS